MEEASLKIHTREEEKKMSRKEKRKAMKKMKRKETRKEIAVKERAEDEARLNNPEEQKRMELLEQQETERVERDKRLFEERERAWIEERTRRDSQQQQQLQSITQQQQEHTNFLEESEPVPNGNENDDDDAWEYVEEGPPQIIWQGNEIIFKKNKVRVRVSNKEPTQNQDTDNRPTSNPLPPEYRTNSPTQQALENVVQQIPNFGTEQDKAHCPFHLKTGACRFGQRCSRVHFYPDTSCTILIKNMYNGPGLAWEQDEGLEYMDEEVERCFEEFYEDVHTEFLKFGEIVNFKVCKNGSFHLRGNVYVQYKFLDSALLAYNSVNGRYFAGKQVSCNFVNLTRWKVAICGEYMKSGFKTCSHGTACNFIHCFRNPGGDYEWADSDRPPPKYWVKEMAALFGYSENYEALREEESLSLLKNTSKMSKTDSGRYYSTRSRSWDIDRLNSFSGRRKHGGHERKQKTTDEEWNANLKDNNKMKRKTHDTVSDREQLEKYQDRENHHKRARKSSLNSNKNDSSKSHDEDFDMGWATISTCNGIEHGRETRNSRKGNRGSRESIYEIELNGDSDRKRHRIGRRKSPAHQSRGNRTFEAESSKHLFDRGDSERRDFSRKSSRRNRSGLQDDNKDYENENDEVDGGLLRRESDERALRKKDSSKHQKYRIPSMETTKSANLESSRE